MTSLHSPFSANRTCTGRGSWRQGRAALLFGVALVVITSITRPGGQAEKSRHGGQEDILCGKGEARCPKESRRLEQDRGGVRVEADIRKDVKRE